MTVYYKMRQILLQNPTAILLLNAIEIYYKIRQVFYYKKRQFYQKCDSYYNMRRFYYTMQRLLQISTVQCRYHMSVTILNQLFAKASAG